MAIKISGTTVIDDSRNIQNIGVGTVTTLTSTNVTSTNINVTGVSTFVTANITQSNPTNLNVSGISTLGNVRITSGIVTSTTGIITYYGDGTYLTGVSAGSGASGDITGSLFF